MLQFSILQFPGHFRIIKHRPVDLISSDVEQIKENGLEVLPRGSRR